MRLGVALSSTAHAAVLAWGLLSFSAPAPLEVADVEALPIDIVPIEEFTQSVQGDKKADLSETPAPKPTQRPDVVENAENIGESQNDLKPQPEAKPAEQPVEVAKAETPPPSPTPTPAPKQETEVPPAPEDTPAPTTEMAALNEPAVPVTEEVPSEEATPAEASEQFASLQDVSVVPTRRPEPPKPKTAETTKRKKPEKPASTKSASSDKKEEKVTDEIASLLNKQEPASSGAKKSDQQASLGTRKPSKSGKLSTSEMDALRAAIEQCWSVPAGLADAEDMRVTVTIRLLPDGSIEGRPDVQATGGESGARRAFAGSARRAVQKCAPYSLPKEKYDTWAEVVVNFSAAEMF